MLARTLLVPSLLALASGCNLPKYEPEPLPGTLVLSITGMTSADTCPARVEDALESVTGVEAATVDYASRTARVEYLGRCPTNELLLALRRQGFGAVAR